MASEESVAIRQSLAGLSKTMSSHMEGISRSTVSFREAATQHNRNLSGIIKDVFSSVAGQRKELSQTNDSIEEAFSGIQQGFRENSRATDSLGASMEKVLSVQYKTLSELSQMNRNFNTLIYNTSGGVLSNIFGGVFGKSWFDNLGTALKAIGLGAAATAPFFADRVGGGGGNLGPGLGQSGSSSEAMSFFQSKGWTKEQSAGIVGNLQAESGKNLRTNAVGDNGQAYGIAQWHPDRQRKFEEVMHVPIRQSTFQQQLEFVNWELNNTEAQAGRIIKSAQSAEQAAALMDQHYERSSGAHRGERMANANALLNSKGAANPTTPPTSSVTTNTTNITNTTAPDPTRQMLPPGTPTVTGPGGRTEGGAVGVSLPQNDIVALGKTLQQQGFRISEHPAFGGVSGATAQKPWGVHSKTGGHGDGSAIDINIGEGNIEANDPVMGKKFDQLAEQLRSAGYSVIWRAPGHYNHLHARANAAGVTPQTPGTATTPGSSGAGNISGEAQQGATVDPRLASGDANQIMSYARETASADISSKMGGMMPMTPMMGAMGSIVPMMGAGGIGGIGGMLGPIMGILGSLGGGQLQQQEFAQQLQPSFETANRLQTAAVEEKIIASMQQKPADPEQRETEPSQFAQSTERHYPQGSYSEYNTDNHLYPEWASMVYDIYGRFTGSKGGNIKTSLA